MAEGCLRHEKGDAGPTFTKAEYKGGDKRVARDYEQLHLMLGLPAVSIYSPDFYSMQLYAAVLGGGMSSRLFQEVREKRGLTYTVYAANTAHEDEGVMSIYAACAPKKAKELSNVLMDEIMDMTKGVSKAELDRAKNQYKAEILMGREKSQTVAADIGRQLLMFGEYKSAKKIAALIDDVTPDDIKRVAKELIKGTLTVAGLGKISGIPPYEELAKKLT
jgi:predicted Zn-dependent peptidase